MDDPGKENFDRVEPNEEAVFGCDPFAPSFEWSPVVSGGSFSFPCLSPLEMNDF